MQMKAVELTGTEGFKSLRLSDVPKPTPGATEILIEVKAAGLNYAEIEQTRGKYPVFKPLPFVMGFEASGIVSEVGSEVKAWRVGDRVAAIVSSGGYAEYALADASAAIPIQNGTTFAEATAITIQGLSAYALLKLAAKPQPPETVLETATIGDRAHSGRSGRRWPVPCPIVENSRSEAGDCAREYGRKARPRKRTGSRCCDQLRQRGLGGSSEGGNWRAGGRCRSRVRLRCGWRAEFQADCTFWPRGGVWSKEHV